MCFHEFGNQHNLHPQFRRHTNDLQFLIRVHFYFSERTSKTKLIFKCIITGNSMKSLSNHFWLLRLRHFFLSLWFKLDKASSRPWCPLHAPLVFLWKRRPSLRNVISQFIKSRPRMTQCRLE